MNAPAVSERPLTVEGFVGRHGELAELHAGLEDALRGRGRCFLISGEPGIGKTRLADEVTTAALARGFQVYWGRCWEGGGAPAFWPWTQVLRNLVHDDDPDALAAQLGAARALITADAVAAVPGDPEVARFRLFDAVSAFLSRAVASRPLTLVLDDLHSADHDSLLLLQFIARELRVLRLIVIGTFRESEARRLPGVGDRLADIARDGMLLPLRGLNEAEVGDLVGTVLRRTGASQAVVPPPFIAAVHRITEGNPFFVESIVRILSADGRLPWADGTESVRIPDQIRDTVRRRLQPLSAESVHVLSAAAVMGREFDARILERVHSAPAAAVGPALDAAVEAGIVVALPGGVGRYSFTHALIRETLYDDLPPGARATWHHAIGTTLAAMYGTSIDAHVAEVAHHFYQAATGGYAEPALRYALRAANDATALYAYDEAVKYWEHALEVFQLLPTSGGEAHEREARRGTILLGLGTALNGAGNRLRAKEVFAQAAACARAAGDGESLARAALGYGGEWLGYAEVANFDQPADAVFDEHPTRLLIDALAALGEHDTPLRARLLSRLALEGYFTAPFEERESLTRDAVGIARRSGDLTTLAHVLSETHVALWAPHTVAARLTLSREITRLGQAIGQPALESAGRSWSFQNLLELGETDDLAAEFDAFIRFAERTREPGLLWSAKCCRVLLAQLRGQFAEAEQLAREALRIGRRSQRPALMAYTLHLVPLRREQGRLAELAQAAGVWQVLAERFPNVPSVRTQLALYYSDTGRHAEARTEFEHFASRDFDNLPRNVTWLVCLTELAEVCAALGDTRRAAPLYARLLPYADHNPVGVHGTVCWGSVSRSLGMLTALMEQWDDATRHFERALERNRALGARPLVAHTQHAYAEMLLRLSTADPRGARRTQAEALMLEAGETATALGMKVLAEKLAALHERSSPSIVGPPSQRAAATATPAAPHTEPSGMVVSNRFRKEGEYWTVAYDGATFRLKHTSGLAYIAQLLRHPGEEVHAAVLVHNARAGEVISAASGSHAPAVVGDGDWSRGANEGDAGALLDEQAKGAYRERLAELRDDLEEAQTRNDIGRTERLQTEIAFLTQELARAIGLSGRDRRAGSLAERARVNATRSIAAALKRIGEQHAGLGRHFARTIKTGTYCVYAPDPRVTIDWQL